MAHDKDCIKWKISRRNIREREWLERTRDKYQKQIFKGKKTDSHGEREMRENCSLSYLFMQIFVCEEANIIIINIQNCTGCVYDMLE